MTETPIKFSKEEIAQIEETVATRNAPNLCPHCGATLEISQPLGAGHSVATIFEATCPRCGRTGLLRDLPQRIKEGDRPNPPRRS